MAKKQTKKKTKKKTKARNIPAQPLTAAKDVLGKSSVREVSAESAKKAKPDSAHAGKSHKAAGSGTFKPDVVPMPTAGRKVLEFEDRLDASLAKAKDEPGKPKRGRPPKADEPPVPEIDVKVFAQCIQIPFDLWAASQDVPELKISIDEAVTMAKPLKQLSEYYLPNVPEIAWAWFSLAGVSYAIVKSRLVLIAEIKKARPSTSEAGTDEVKGQPVNQSATQGQGGPRSGFPNISQIKDQVTKPDG